MRELNTDTFFLKDKDFDVYLRPINDSDSACIIKWRNSLSVKKYFIYQDDLTLESQKKWIRTKVASGEVIQFMIINIFDDQPIGSIYLRNIDYKNNKAEFGIFIGDVSQRGKGFGVQATKLLIRYAFLEKKLHRIYLRVFSDNLNAISSYKKIGFKYEGESIDDVFVNGKYRNLTWMSIIKR